VEVPPLPPTPAPPLELPPLELPPLELPPEAAASPSLPEHATENNGRTTASQVSRIGNTSKRKRREVYLTEVNCRR
jgi:hypothetical protein